MRNEIAFGLMLLACGVGVLVGRAVPHDPLRAPQAVPRPVPSATVVDTREPSCSAEREALAQTKAQLSICMAFTLRDPPVEAAAEAAGGTQVEPPAEAVAEMPEDSAAKGPGRLRRNIDVLKKHGEAIVVRHSDGRLVYYPPDAQIDDGLIVARILPSGEVAHYDPDAGPRTDPSAFRVPPPGSPNALPKMETGPDGLVYVNGKLASPAVQKMFAIPPR